MDDEEAETIDEHREFQYIESPTPVVRTPLKMELPTLSDDAFAIIHLFT